jgi:hypothetical protein
LIARSAADFQKVAVNMVMAPVLIV